MTRALMLQGTGSNVGKSLLVAGLCRAARRRGLSVAPFKPQNMSNNAAVTADGGEIGRAQALQAMACGLEPHTDMNPVLLKPETDTGAQVIVQGRRFGHSAAGSYGALKAQLMGPVLESCARLRAAHDLVIVEGAGSPAEINLRARDIANMGFARAADVPVVLIGDIHRGGVIAQIVGTQAVLDADDAAMIAGFVINRFRGDVRLFDDGYAAIAARTGWTGFGVVPWFFDAVKLPAEDALDLPRGGFGAGLKIAVPALSRIANFDDLDPLSQEPGVSLSMIAPGQPIPGDTDLVILPGSKSTRGDLAFLRAQGWDVDIAAHVRRGGHVLGICGGYQMLGRVVRDPMGLEGAAGDTPGLGLLDVETVMSDDKRLTRVGARHVPTGAEMQGYEIHLGRTTGRDRKRPFADAVTLASGMATHTGETIAGPMNAGTSDAGAAETDATDGAISADGRISGTYLHGMFSDDRFRAAWLAGFGVQASGQSYGAVVDQTLDALADHLEQHMDVTGLLAVAR